MDITFLCAICWVWKYRNNVIFGEANMCAFHVCKSIILFKETCIKAFVTSMPATSRSERLVQWMMLEHGTLKVNTDRSSFGNLKCTGLGGLIWDEFGRIIGFSIYIGISTNMYV